MKKSSSLIFISALLLVFCLSACGCEYFTIEKDAYAQACEYYAKGEYAMAAPLFAEAEAAGINTFTARTGYAFNMYFLGRYAEADARFEELKADSVCDDDTRMRILEAQLITTSAEGETGRLADCYIELAQFYSLDKYLEYMSKGYELKAQIHREAGLKEELENDLKELIGLKEYAGEEYLELFDLYRSMGRRDDELALAQELDIYAAAHSSHITNFGPAISVMMEAAAIAPTDGEKNRDFYFSCAQKLVEKAEEKNASDRTVLRYKIVIAEKQGKMDLAYRLLGVYLNHFPDDSAAIKERSYLRSRLGIED